MSTFYAEYPVKGGGGSAGVGSINTLTGDLTLVGGSGITITDNGSHTITITNSAVAGANRTLSNLTSPTAINQAILPGLDATYDLGSALLGFENLFLNGGQLQVDGNLFVGSFARGAVGVSSANGHALTLSSDIDMGINATGAVVFSTTTGIDAGTSQIINLADPTAPQDAATQAYVDAGDAAAANKSLSNLTATAFNVDLIPGTTNVRSIGDGTHLLNTVFIGATGSGVQLQSGITTVGNLRAVNTTPSGVANVPGFLSNAVSTIGYPAVLGSQSESTANANATGTVYVESGNKTAGTGNSGDIQVRTGTSAGGTRGKVRLQDGTQGTSGHVWTSVDTVGTGSWSALPSSANTTLSNLGTTSINKNLNFNTGVQAVINAPQSLAIISPDVTGADSASAALAMQTGTADDAINNNSTTGGIGLATGAIGASGSTAASGSIALLTGANNGGPTGDIAIGTGTANSISVQGRIFLSAAVQFPSTVTAGGTNGNQTINKPSGTVNIAASGTSVTVTNSLVSTSSIVFAVLRTADATATIKNVVPGNGSFVITLGAAATGAVSIGFFVINK